MNNDVTLEWVFAGLILWWQWQYTIGEVSKKKSTHIWTSFETRYLIKLRSISTVYTYKGEIWNSSRAKFTFSKDKKAPESCWKTLPSFRKLSLHRVLISLRTTIMPSKFVEIAKNSFTYEERKERDRRKRQMYIVLTHITRLPLTLEWSPEYHSWPTGKPDSRFWHGGHYKPSKSSHWVILLVAAQQTDKYTADPTHTGRPNCPTQALHVHSSSKGKHAKGRPRFVIQAQSHGRHLIHLFGWVHENRERVVLWWESATRWCPLNNDLMLSSRDDRLQY